MVEHDAVEESNITRVRSPSVERAQLRAAQEAEVCPQCFAGAFGVIMIRHHWNVYNIQVYDRCIIQELSDLRKQVEMLEHVLVRIKSDQKKVRARARVCTG